MLTKHRVRAVPTDGPEEVRDGGSLRCEEDKISGSVYSTSLCSSKDEYGSQYSSYNSLEQARMNEYLDSVNRLRHSLQEVHPDVDDEMASEEKRLETFNQWPKESPVKPADLVKAGFYYTGPGDRVSCFSCDLQLRNWVEGDNPLEEHRRLKPTCIFIVETEKSDIYAVTCHGEPVSSEATSGNIPLRPNLDMQYKDQSFPSYNNPSIVNTEHFDPRYQTPYTAPYLPHVSSVIQSQQRERYLQQQQEYLNHHRGPRSLLTQESLSNRRDQFIPSFENSSSLYSHHQIHPAYYPSVNYPSSASQNWYLRQTHPYLQPPYQFSMTTVRPPQTRFPVHGDQRPPSVTQENLTPSSSSVILGYPQRPCNQNSGIPVLHPMPTEGPHVRIEDALHSTSMTELQSEHHRMTTFVDWPEDCPVRPWELASAGFYYLGNQDNVKCYKCAVMLRNWEPQDTPWEEHKRWSPDCPLVIAHYAGKHAYQPVEDQEQVPSRTPSTTSQTTGQHYSKSAVPHRPQFEYQGKNPNWSSQTSGVSSSPKILQSIYPSYSFSHDQERTSHYPRTYYRGQENTSGHQSHEQEGWRQVEQEIWTLNDRQRSPQSNILSNEPHISSSCTVPITAQGGSQTSREGVSNLSRIPSNEVSYEVGLECEGLSSRDVMRAMEMGFTRNDIDEAIAIKTERTGNGFTTLGDLMQALLDNQNSTATQQVAGNCRPDPEPQIIDRNERNMDQREQAQLNMGLLHSISYHPDPAVGVKQILKRSNSAPPGSATNTGTQGTSALEKTQEERLICKICMDAEVGVVFLPCGHISCCPNCASGLDLCPMCRNPIEKMHRTFLS